MQPMMGRSLGLSQLNARCDTPVYHAGEAAAASAPADFKNPRRDRDRLTENSSLREPGKRVRAEANRPNVQRTCTSNRRNIHNLFNDFLYDQKAAAPATRALQTDDSRRSPKGCGSGSRSGEPEASAPGGAIQARNRARQQPEPTTNHPPKANHQPDRSMSPKRVLHPAPAGLRFRL